jgi:DNA-directed RNA polymerase III subunit RPC4
MCRAQPRSLNSRRSAEDSNVVVDYEVISLTYQDQIGRGKAFPRPWAPSSAHGGASQHFNSIDSVKREDDGFKREPGVQQKRVSSMLYSGEVKREEDDGGYISSDADDTGQGPRKDITFIDLTSDKEDGPEGEGRSLNRFNSPAQPPIRINRIEHRDRAPALNPHVGDTKIKRLEDAGDVMEIDDPESSVKKVQTKSKDVEVVATSRRWKGVYQDEDEVDHIKNEPMDDGEVPPSSVERPTRVEQTKDTKPKRIHKSSHKAQVSFLQTEEERAEFLRYETDLELLVSELGQIGPTTAHLAAESDEGNGASSAPGPDQKADRVYLFQLPPVVPDLVVPVPIVIKDEPNDAPIAESNTSQSAGDSTQIKQDPPTTIKIEDEKPIEPTRAAHLATLASGIAGKLRVHKSGKVALNWGGANLQVSKGMDSNFLQDIILVRRGTTEEPQDTAAEPLSGDALAFGQVRGKFVVTPDWDEVLKPKP